MKSTTRSFYEQTVRAAVERIVGNLDEALNLGQLARGAALSPLHFHHIFRGMLGETPLELHRRLRLERAASRLASERTSITSIAFHAGYETHESFTRAFRQAYASSPSEFRERASAPRDGCAAQQLGALASRSGIHFEKDSTTDLTTIQAGDITMNVSIETMPALRLAAVRHVGPYDTISEAFARLGTVAGPAGLATAQEGTMVAIYHDDPEATPAAQLRSDAGILVPDSAQVPASLSELHIPAGRYARTTHLGPYSNLGDTWARLMGEWLPTSGLRVGEGVSYEIYRNDPRTSEPSQLRTDIYVPVA